MKQAHCSFEEEITQASRSGKWSDDLLAHVADCHSCEEVALVASYLCESNGAERASAPLPDAGRIWSKAQLAARSDAMERAMRPIVWMRRFAFGLSVAGLLVSVITWWTRLGGFFSSFAESWTHQPAAASAGPDALPLIVAAFLLILVPLVFGLYAAWAED